MNKKKQARLQNYRRRVHNSAPYKDKQWPLDFEKTLLYENISVKSDDSTFGHSFGIPNPSCHFVFWVQGGVKFRVISCIGLLAEAFEV